MIQCISTIEQFNDLKDEWDFVYRKSGLSNLFLTHEWLTNWLVHFGENKWIVLKEQTDSTTVSYVLLRINDNHASLIKTGHSNFPGFLSVHRSTAPRRSIIEFLKSEVGCKSISLIQSPDDPNFEAQVREAAENGWLMVKKNWKVLRSINLSCDFEEYLSCRDKKVRHELRRKERKIQFSGEIALKCIEKEADVESLFSIIDEIEKDSWKFQSRTAIVSSEKESSFYKSVYTNYAKMYASRAYVLEQNRVPISYVMGVVFDGTYYALKTSYKESYKKLSPGTVLFFKIIEALCGRDEKLKKIELLGGDARWKEELATDGRNFCTYQLFAKTVRNICFLAARKCAKGVISKLRTEG